MTKLKSLLAAVMLVAFAQTPAFADALADGATAALKGDFQTAFKLWKPLADQGNAKAQFKLGFMYENGKGVTKDNIEAVKWYRKAAEQGHAWAQTNLGVMYMLGKGVKKSAVDAYVWFNFAAAAGDENAKKDKATISKKMTPAQIDEAQKKSTVY
jgi:uncharacterized protein